IQFYLSFPVEQESSLFRNSSPMSLIRNTFDFLNMPVEFLTGTSIFMILFILVWFGIRFFQREKNHGPNYLSSTDVNLFHNMGHLLDFSVISLLIAPSAWEHHYVLAIPLMLWVFQLRIKDKPWHVLIGFVLVFGMPVFNVFPSSYLRLAGLVLLLILALPRQARH
ncbi:MAG TPA: hypothetical protein PLX90_09435, partial [Anaerolineales bacterium]|nr:hypothetical protein [Anaerolineales bacterium]